MSLLCWLWLPKALNSVYLELYNWGPESAQKVASFGRKHILLYAELSKEFMLSPSFHTLGYTMYKMYPKHHLMIHLVEDTGETNSYLNIERINCTIGTLHAAPEDQMRDHGNLKSHWCYPDEASIGLAVKLAESCHPLTLQKVVIQKHRL